MQVLIDDADLPALQARLAREQGAERLAAAIELAWHLRQRDTAQALQWADTAQALLVPDAQAAGARLALIRAELRLLFADFAGAESGAHAALAAFTACADGAGCCDSWWLLARLASDRGDPLRRDAALVQARRFATDCGDTLRAGLMDGLVACHAAFGDTSRAEAEWGAAMAAQVATGHPALLTWACDFHACIALDRSEHAQAVPWLRQAFDAAGRSGQIKKAIATAANIGLVFARLNDHGSALEWAELALALARRVGWPSSVGVSLLQTAAALDQLDRPDAAAEMVGEALAVLAPLTGTFNYLLGLVHLGQLELRRGRPQAALDAFSELDRRTQQEHRQNFRVSVLLGQARACAALGDADAGFAAAHEALATAAAATHANYQIDALRVLAELHSKFDTPEAALRPLEAAFEIGAGLSGYTLPADLLVLAAELQAACGRPERAYALALQASAAREASQGREARNRAIAMQVRHDTERARADSEHHRLLAAAETRRAAALSEALAAQHRLQAEREQTLAFLAHDLRAPLAAIVAMPLADTRSDEGLALQRAARFAGRALALTDRFLTLARLSRLPADALVPLDLAGIVDDAIETFAQRAFAEGKAIAPTLVFGITITGHREAWVRALCNLIDNALRFTPPAGRIDVGMRLLDQAVELVIADAGPGMPAAAQAVLRGEPEGGVVLAGRLGLTIVAEVARLHGVPVEVSASSAGTRVAMLFQAATR